MENSHDPFIFEGSSETSRGLWFAECHAVSLAVLRGGGKQVWASCFAGTRERHPDTAIWVCRGEQGTWQTPFRLVKAGVVAHWNPVLFVSPDDHLHLFFKVGIHPSRWQTFHMKSANASSHSPRWSEPRPLPNLEIDGLHCSVGPVRNKILVLSSGHWLAPGSVERFLVDAGGVPRYVWDAYVSRSEDAGHTWCCDGLLPYDRSRHGPWGGVIQPVLWSSGGRLVHMLLRSSLGVICRSDSEDEGRTWAPVETTNLLHNNSGIDVEQASDGTLVLAHNPVSGNWAERTPLSLAFSSGEGHAWSNLFTVAGGFGQFSYPWLSVMGEEMLLAYTWNRLGIAWRQFCPQTLAAPISG
jgi:predicted neuraminidase